MALGNVVLHGQMWELVQEAQYLLLHTTAGRTTTKQTGSTRGKQRFWRAQSTY